MNEPVAYIVVRPDASRPWAVGDEVQVLKVGEPEPVAGIVTALGISGPPPDVRTSDGRKVILEMITDGYFNPPWEGHLMPLIRPPVEGNDP